MINQPLRESEIKKFKITVQYLGTNYHGWQIQHGQTTIQGVLKETLSTLAGTPITISGASRTDSGVHAFGQVAHFFFPPRNTIPDLRRTLNALLPRDIRVLRLGQVSADFHAQKSARKKRYEYRIYNGPVLPPFSYGRACHIVHPLNFERMELGAQLLMGRHDFSGFAASTTTTQNRVREIGLSQMIKRGRNLAYRVEADGFLHHMVRNIAGTLLEIGLQKRSPDSVTEILAKADRRKAGVTAPPEGLYLVRIWY
ncbi:MAG: tRNA pseudouridine(38-40) synthase TruA [bacterium]